jgi:hypothetical protein
MTPIDLLAIARLTRGWTVDADDFPPTAPVKALARRMLTGTPWEPLLECRWCTSVWVAVVVMVAKRTAPRAWRPAAGIFAASQVAGMLGLWEETQHAQQRAAEAAQLQSMRSVPGP